MKTLKLGRPPRQCHQPSGLKGQHPLSGCAAQGVHEGRPGEPPSGQWRVACGKDHHLPLGERRSRQKDRRQPLTEG